MRTIDADALKYAIVEEGQRSKRYKLGEFWELNGDEIWQVIDAQPTIEPEPHWIPVSERLPEDDKRFFNALKPNKEIDRSWGIGMKVPVCPNCEAIISPMCFWKNCKDKVGWCEYCGQKIDWSGWEDE